MPWLAQILGEKYTAVNPAVKCPYCEKSACLKCQKQYILSVATEPRCMDCTHAWTPEIIDSVFPKSFRLGELHKRRVEMLADNERASFPQLMLDAQINDINVKLKTGDENMLKKRRDFVKYVKTEMCSQKGWTEQVVRDDVDYYLEEYFQAIDEYYTYKEDLDKLEKQRKEEKKKPAAGGGSVLRPCPTTDCKGFIPKGTFVCTLNCIFCTECEECMTADDHVCKKETLETIKAIKADTKPCPKCSVPIHRTEGCDQMWCTSCHTTFDWKTLEIVKKGGRIHNPHFINYINNQTQCGTAWPYGDNPKHFKNGAVKNEELFKNLFYNMACINNSYTGRNADAVHDAAIRKWNELRMVGKIDDKKWKAQLGRIEKERIKKQHIRQIEMSLLVSVRDVLAMFANRHIDVR